MGQGGRARQSVQSSLKNVYGTAVFRLPGLAAVVQPRAGLKTDGTDGCEACLRPIAVGAPTTLRACSPSGRLSNGNPNRRCLFFSCAVAALSSDPIDRAPRLVVRKQPVVALASWLTNSCSSFAWVMEPRTYRIISPKRSPL